MNIIYKLQFKSSPRIESILSCFDMSSRWFRTLIPCGILRNVCENAKASSILEISRSCWMSKINDFAVSTCSWLRTMHVYLAFPDSKTKQALHAFLQIVFQLWENPQFLNDPISWKRQADTPKGCFQNDIHEEGIRE